MNTNLIPIHRPNALRVWVWIPVLVFFGLPMVLLPTVPNLVIGGLVLAGVGYFEAQHARRGVWETETDLVITNRGDTRRFEKSRTRLLVADGGEYAWIGWRSAERPAFDNGPKLPRLYLTDGDGHEKVRIEAALGLNRPKVLALGERIDAALVG